MSIDKNQKSNIVNDSHAKRLYGIVMKSESKHYMKLSSLRGIGQSLAIKICKSLSIDPEKKGDFSDNEMLLLRNHIEVSGIKIGADLRNYELSNINMSISIGSYTGQRHKNGYPVRGQRTKNNAKTAKKRRLFK